MRTDTQRVEFPNGRGQALAARLERPVGRPRAYALFAHCFTCSKDVAAATRIARGLARRGIAVLRFDFTGLGNSEGDFANTSFASNTDDLVAASDWLRAEHAAPALLVGHSLGGAAVLAAAPRVPEVLAVATLGAPSEPRHALRHFGAAELEEIRAAGEGEVVLAGRRFRIGRQLVDDLEESRLLPGLAELDRALLVMHSPVDEIVGIENARRLYEAARHPKSFVALDGADHLLGAKRDSEFVADVLAAWAERYLPPRAEPDGPAEGLVRVEELGRYEQRVRAGHHELRADEPASMGGTDRGPTPYDLLLAALGTCTSMTVRMVADRKGWPLEGVRVDLRHERVHAKDCADCETREGQVSRIERSLALEGPLDDEQRARLLEIADKCPVHRTLTGEIVVATDLEPAAERRE